MTKTLLRIGFLSLMICAFVAFLNMEARAQGGGKDLFLKNQCNKCHSVSAQGVEKIKSDDEGGKQPPDLSHAGKERNAAWLVGWLNRTEKINGKTHKKKFTGSPADAQALATWLAGLK